jgi:hypothetical protein
MGFSAIFRYVPQKRTCFKTAEAMHFESKRIRASLHFSAKFRKKELVLKRQAIHFESERIRAFLYFPANNHVLERIK